MQLVSASGAISKAPRSNEPATKQKEIKALLLADRDESQYVSNILGIIKSNFRKHSCKLITSFDNFDSMSMLQMSVEKEFDFVFISNPKIIQLCFPGKEVSQTEAAGSVYFKKYCILPPLNWIYTIKWGEFYFKRILAKGFEPEQFLTFPSFTWEWIKHTEDFDRAYKYLSACLLISVDIETIKANLGIDCISFSGLHSTGAIRTYSFHCSHPFFFTFIRKILRLDIPKTFQNGLYDISYLIRWNCTPVNWLHDTAYFEHSWFSELKKDLGFLGSYFLLDFQYWKKEGKYAKSREDRLRYNAKDAYATLCIAIAQLSEAPKFAFDNFKQNFPNFFPSLFCSLHGIHANFEKLGEALIQARSELERDEQSLRRMIGIKDFNAGSPKQVETLLGLFGLAGQGTNEKVLEKLSARHPILERILGKVLDIRANKKAIGTYFTPTLISGNETWEFDPTDPFCGDKKDKHFRILYTLNPAATETNRLASYESAFWCGTNIQNQPAYTKTYFEADPGFEIVEVDNQQSETRCTAYISEEPNLLKVVNDSTKDFHTSNVTMFFGDDYESIRAEVKKLKAQGESHPKRELAKRINHGKSYNMGPDVFVQTVGPKIINLARSNLRLDPTWTSREVAEYLLSLFDKAYPGLASKWYPKVIKEIAFTGKLVGATGWTRHFFAQPTSSKHALNSAIAHGPQSLSVNILNIGFRRCFWEIQLVEPENFRLLAQIHDSIVAEIRIGHTERLVKKMQECMRNPIMVNGRELLIPTDAKIAGRFWNSSSKSALQSMKIKKQR